MTEVNAISPALPVLPSILRTDNKLSWDFATITAFPVLIGQAVVKVHLTPYTSEELHAILKKALSGYRREKKDMELVREDPDIYNSLFDSHFVKLSDATGTPDEQRAFIERNNLKPSIVQYTFAGLQMDAAKKDESSVLDISLDLSSGVEVYQELHDTQTNAVVRVVMVHKHTQPSETQFRKYRNARRNKFVKKTNLWVISEDHGVLEKLYDEVVISISGGAVSGKFCALDNKAAWIAGVPLWHKLHVVDQIFADIVEKND